jgi:hypothetical protein
MPDTNCPFGIGASTVDLGGADTRALGRDTLLTDDPALFPFVARFRTVMDATGGDPHALAAQATAMHAVPIPLSTITANTLVLAGDRDPWPPAQPT